MRVSRPGRLIGSVLLAAVCAANASAYAGNAADWLMKMNEASTAISYDGMFVYMHDGQIEAMRVIHIVDDGLVRERLYSLNGATREVIRDDRQVWCYLPDQKIGFRELRQASDANFPSILPRRIDKLHLNYDFRLGKLGRIAQRQTQQIIIEPKDEFRYGYNLWADNETGLLLKADLVDSFGESIEQYMFTQINLDGDVSVDDLTPSTPKQELKWFGLDPDVNQEPTSLNWEVTEIPDGFMLSGRVRRLSPVSRQTVEHLVYSDGLAAVSVFIEKKTKPSEQASMLGMSSMGAVHAFGTVIEDHQITVVGEVPSKTVDMIGMSVTPR
ncbi:MAG: MucB/RseB C-terminal domain-containing protein [Gammaproteobacteria bacterium]|nr:MucB/RseB C-terminal domain-containing protein [Gammaproteobacteria bacterium]